MKRQPYLPKYKGEGFDIGARVIEQRPNCVYAIGRCLALWPFVEHHQAMLLGDLLGADDEASIAAFTVIRRGSIQKEVLLAVAEKKLDEKSLGLVTAILKYIASVEKERADIAHGHWGILKNFEDKVLWIEAKDHSPWNIFSRNSKQHIGHEGLKKHLFVVRIKDIDEVYSRIEEAWKLLFDLKIWLRGGKTKGVYKLAGDELYNFLINHKEVRGRL